VPQNTPDKIPASSKSPITTSGERIGRLFSCISYGVARTKDQPLDYYIHDGPAVFGVQLKGFIDDEGARRLDQVWRTASSLPGGRRPMVDITFVTGVEEEGRQLLMGWHRSGVHLAAASEGSRALAEAVLGVPLAAPSANWRRDVPFRLNLSKPAAGWRFLMAALLFAVPASAANLKTETVSSWNDYLQTAEASLQQRVQPGSCFLWTFENPDRAAKVRAGEIIAAPAPGPNPKNVPGGLIHHWIGAIFLPGVTIGRVSEVTRDYDRYKDYYHPSVIQSTFVARDDATDRFSMRMMNKTFFVKSALDTDYAASYVRLDENRLYSVSRSTRIQEIERLGEAGEHKVPEGEGRGYVWKLFSIARLEQRDQGVYLELEAIALSREIPPAARFFVDPIVRSISRNSMLISLRETREALRGYDASATR